MKSTTKIGLTVGIAASIYLAILAVIGDFGGSFLKYGKYAIIVTGLIYFYKQNVENWKYEKFVGNYIGSSINISLIGGILIGISNLILFYIDPSFAIQKYNLSAQSIGQLAVINGVILVETVVLGLLVAYVIYPFFKNIPHDNSLRPSSPRSEIAD
jgi:hypothetical protein